MSSVLLCLKGRRGENLNPEEINMAGETEMSDSLSLVHEQ